MRIEQYLKEDEEIHKDVEINRKYLDEVKGVRDGELKNILLELIHEEEEHQKRKIDLIRRALRRVEQLKAISSI
jgi:hypothetical protein